MKTSEFREVTDPERFKADYDQGLTVAQVKQRIAEGLDNKPVESPSKTVKEILADNIFTYFNLIFVILSVLLIIVGSYRDLTFMSSSPMPLSVLSRSSAPNRCWTR